MRVYHLRDRIILASLISVIPLLAWIMVLQFSRISESRRIAARSHAMIADHIVDGCNGYFDNIKSFEKSAGIALWNAHSIPPREQSQYLQRITRDHHAIVHLAAIDMSGRVVAADIPSIIGMDTLYYPSIRKVLHGASWAVSDVSTFKHITGPVVAVNVGIKDNSGKQKGLVVAFLSQESMKNILERDINIGLHRSAEVIITDSKGSIFIARGPMNIDPQKRDWSKYTFVHEALAGRPARFEGYEISAENKVLGTSDPIKSLGWAISVFTPEKEILGAVHRSVLLNAFAAIFFAMLTVSLALFTGNRLSKPIMRLSDTARSFGEGNLHARAATGSGDEFDLLASSFNEMASVLQSQTEQLNDALIQESKARHRASVLYLIAQGIVVNVNIKARLEVISQALASICEVKRCSVFLSRGDRLVGVTGWGLSDPDAFPGLELDILGKSGFPRESLIAGIPILISDVSAEPRVREDLTVRYHIKGLLAIPLIRRKHLVGLAVLDNPDEFTHFDEEAISTARGVASLAAIAVENAELYEKWVKISEAFQGAMLPNIPTHVGSFEMACKYYAAIQMAELGGDFYDLITFPDGRIGFVIADVSGKGLEAAIFTAMGKYTIRAFAAENPEPASVLTRANRAISGVAEQMGFLTIFYGLLDPNTGKLVYGNAGHPPPLITREDADPIWLSGEERQPPMGVLEDMGYHQWEFHMNPGDILTCYTDGVIEARRNGDMFDMERLAQVVRSVRDKRPDEITETVHKAVVDFSRGKIQDDIAILVVERSNGTAKS